MNRHPSSTVARLLLLLAVGTGAFLSHHEAQGQGVPSWAPLSSPDGGAVAPPRAHPMDVYRADGGIARAEKSLGETLEFLIGFNPLVPSDEELKRKAARPVVVPHPDGGVAMPDASTLPPAPG